MHELNNEYEISLVIVIPVYNEEKTITENFSKLRELLSKDGISPAFMLVDDGSCDLTWEKLDKLSKKYKDTGCLRLSRNFGKEAAIFAGLSNICASRYLVMDSDLQHPPRYVKEMLTIMDSENVDIVEGVKSSRNDHSFMYKFFATKFYKFLAAISGIELNNSSDFKLLNKQVVDSLKEFGETTVFFRGIVYWAGFKKSQFYFEVDKREGDTSRFSPMKLIVLAFDSILSYTSSPLYLTVLFGIIFLIAAIILAIETLYMYISGAAVSGFTTVILILLIIGSMIMISLGIIGAYISKIYNEVKKRPRYIISDRRNIYK